MLGYLFVGVGWLGGEWGVSIVGMGDGGRVVCSMYVVCSMGLI